MDVAWKYQSCFVTIRVVLLGFIALLHFAHSSGVAPFLPCLGHMCKLASFTPLRGVLVVLHLSYRADQMIHLGK